MSKLTRENLSEKDRAVLDSIFDPTFSGNGITYDKHEDLDHLHGKSSYFHEEFNDKAYFC